jgi:hypothetical protein
VEGVLKSQSFFSQMPTNSSYSGVGRASASFVLSCCKSVSVIWNKIRRTLAAFTSVCYYLRNGHEVIQIHRTKFIAPGSHISNFSGTESLFRFFRATVHYRVQYFRDFSPRQQRIRQMKMNRIREVQRYIMYGMPPASQLA